MLDTFTKPKVKDIESWVPLFESSKVTWQIASNHRAFHRVAVAGKKPQYFYGEMAYHQARSTAADADFQAWGAGD